MTLYPQVDLTDVVEQQYLLIQLQNAKIRDLRGELQNHLWVHSREGVRQLFGALDSQPILLPRAFEGLPPCVRQDACCLLWLTGHRVPLPSSPCDLEWPGEFSDWLRAHPAAAGYVCSYVPAPKEVFQADWRSDVTWDSARRMWSVLGFQLLQMRHSRLRQFLGLPLPQVFDAPDREFL